MTAQYITFFLNNNFVPQMTNLNSNKTHEINGDLKKTND